MVGPTQGGYLYNFLFTVFICFMLKYDVASNQIKTNSTFAGYRKWTSSSAGSRDYMYCPVICDDPAEDESCCCCKAKACWEIDRAKCGIAVGQLHIEYIDIFGSASVIGNRSDDVTFHELIHTDGYLQHIPDNICDWSITLTKVDFRSNRISNVDSLRCLTNLDVLMLDKNEIRHISNTTFFNMKYLRTLTLSHNGIENVDPNTIRIQDGNILKIDFSYNEVDTIDVTNLFRPGAFCSISFEYSSIKQQTNLLDFHFIENIIHGPGDISLKHTDIGQFVNFTSLGVTDLSMLSKFFDGQIHVDAASVRCDCNIYQLVSKLGKHMLTYWPELNEFNISFICKSPERMKGKNLTRMYLENDWDELTCDLSVYCPVKCSCTDKPSQDKVVVDCSNKGLTSLPSDMPVGFWGNNHIDLLLDGNDITHLEDRNYLHRLVNLNLSGNNIEAMDSNFAARIPPINIDICDHKLTSFPNNIQHLDPLKIQFGENAVMCDCENTWLGYWIQLNNASGRLDCDVNGEIIPAELVTVDSLECVNIDTESPFILLASSLSAISAIILIIALAKCFRFEIFLLKRKYFSNKTNDSSNIFISFCEENETAFSYINGYIKPTLEHEGYSLSIPWFNVAFGDLRDDMVAKLITESRTCIILLCDMYMETYQTIHEFDIIWKQFSRDTTKNIIVINFDYMDTDSIQDSRLKALKRVGDHLDFSCCESKLVNRLLRKLGPPGVKSDLGPVELKFDLITDANPDMNSKTVPTDINESLTPQNQNGKKAVTVFERLAVAESTCNCKYRKCYLHS